MRRKLAIDPRQIEHRRNRTHLVIVGHHLFKAERIKQLLLIPLQPTHHGPFPPLTASTSENHCSQKPSTDFCNKICQKQKFTTNSPYSLLRAIRPRGRSRHLAVLAQPVQGLMLTEAAQFEMAEFNDRCRNFGGKSTSHEQWPANILAEEFQPAEDVDVAPDGGEVEAIARANIAVCGITIVQSNID